MIKTVKALFCAKDIRLYSLYVFQDLATHEYLMVTVLPDWKVPPLKKDEVGYLNYEDAKAGDTYIDKNEQICKYKKTNLYFKEFIKA